MTHRRRSLAVTEGVQRAPNRAMLRAVGFTEPDFDKPIVGIANGYSTITPCNVGLDQLARRAEAAVRAAGGMPQLFGTITVSDGISMGTEGMKYSLVSREVIADSIETACQAESMDGVVAVGGCDKNMPGAMIAIACDATGVGPFVSDDDGQSWRTIDPLRDAIGLAHVGGDDRALYAAIFCEGIDRGLVVRAPLGGGAPEIVLDLEDVRRAHHVAGAGDSEGDQRIRALIAEPDPEGTRLWIGGGLGVIEVVVPRGA